MGKILAVQLAFASLFIQLINYVPYVESEPVLAVMTFTLPFSDVWLSSDIRQFDQKLGLARTFRECVLTDVKLSFQKKDLGSILWTIV